MKWKITILCCVLVFFGNAKAQVKQFTCRLLTEANGLSDNRVTCFFKDRSGYMWIGTENGLNRYDGRNFTVYHPGQLTRSLSNEYVTGIGQDEDGNLWIATKNGLNRLELKSDSLTVFLPVQSKNGNDVRSLSNSLLWDLYVHSHKVWLAIDNRDLSYYDTRTDTFHYFPWKEFVAKTFPEHAEEYRAIQAIRPGYPNGFWLGTNMGLFGFDTLSHRFEYLGGGQREDVVLLREGRGATGEPFVLFKQEFGGWGAFQPSIGYKKLSAENMGRYLTEVKPEADLWVNAQKKLLHYERKTTQLVPTELAVGDKFAVPMVTGTFQDTSQGCQWLATDQGCYIYSDFLNRFPFIRVSARVPDAPVTIQNALQVNDTTLWITNVKGELVIHRENQPPEYISHIEGVDLNEPAFVFRDSQEVIWLLTRNCLFYYREDRGRFFQMDVPFPEEKVFSVVREDQDGNLWFGSVNAGVYIWYRKENRWERLEDNSNSIPLYVRDVLIDKNGRYVWLATLNMGLVRFEKDTKRIDYYSKDDFPENGLRATSITCLAQSDDGKVWIGTEWGGLSRYDGDIDGRARFTTFTTRDGLPENTIHGILPADRSGLWVSTGRGLVFFNGEGKVKNQWLSSSHYLMQPVRALLHKGVENEFFLPVEQGLLKVRWPLPQDEERRYPFVFREVKMSDTIRSLQAPKLRHRNNQVSFDYQLLRYDSPAEALYEYKLQGLDGEWKRSSYNEVSYLNLSPGAYTFRARAVDASGNLLSEEISYDFIVDKPLWMRWQLWLAVAVIVGIGLYLWWRRLSRQVREEKIVNYFATSLYGRNTVEDVFWDIAKNCISQLGFEDCVIYQFDKVRGILVQKAAYGPKNPEQYEILNPITIEIGQGITGYAALHGEYVLVSDTTKDKRYILDDQQRYSELAVPILIDGQVFGVIDSEHSKKNFFTRRHVRILQKIAGLCDQKLTRYLAEEKLRASIARDLHDEIGSTLTSINIISKIAIEQDNPNKILDYLGSIKENSRQMMDAMSDMVWAINPENDSLQRMFTRLKVFASEILEPAGISYTFEMDPRLPETRLNLNSRKDLYLILKEAVTNAAKYSQASNVKVDFQKKNGSMIIQIQDDGIGMDVNEMTRGNGLKNMKHRAKTINSFFTIQSEKGKGTAIIIRISLT